MWAIALGRLQRPGYPQAEGAVLEAELTGGGCDPGKYCLLARECSQRYQQVGLPCGHG
jgi:hypothetical protein